MEFVEELERLNTLRQNGALTDEEFKKAKEALLSRNQSAGQKIKQAVDDVSGGTETWGLLIHITQFCGYVLPILGWVVPMTLWLLKRNESAIIDKHGRVVMNWLISAMIYMIIFGFLCLIAIGIPFVIVLGILAILYPIIGAIKAGTGEVWNYPGSIRFLPIED
jgi:uncharacterized Tic20 family protein